MLKFIVFFITTVIFISTPQVKGATIQKSNPEYRCTFDISNDVKLEKVELEIREKATNISDNYIMLLINGTVIDNANIVTKNDRTLVPIRVISESINSKIDWDNKTRKVVITKNNNKIELFIDNKEATVNNKKVLLDVAPQIINNYTYLPIRFVSENMNCNVDYVNTKEKGYNEFINNEFPFFFPTVIVEEKSTEKQIPESKALEDLKAKLNVAIKDYTKTLDEAYGKETAETQAELLKTSIPKLELIKEIGRYYVFTHPYVGTYLVDKYTGEIYFFSKTIRFRGIENISSLYPGVFVGVAG